jgi:hypothetical protein
MNHYCPASQVHPSSADECLQSEPGVFTIQAEGMSKGEAAASCVDVHGEGWGLAKFTAQEFGCQQSAVAQAVTDSVGKDQPVMTGVQSADNQCMTATATSTNEVRALIQYYSFAVRAESSPDTTPHRVQEEVQQHTVY